MLWVLIVLLAMAGNAGAQASTPAPTDGARPTHRSTQPTPKLLSAAMPSSAEDRAAESTLLALANQRRREAGVPPLRAEEGLTEAARAHARLMVQREQLSHQFDGEPSLMPRLRESGLRINQAGENVAYNAGIPISMSLAWRRSGVMGVSTWSRISLISCRKSCRHPRNSASWPHKRLTDRSVRPTPPLC